MTTPEDANTVVQQMKTMKKTVMFNPYTGTPRHPSDIASDPSRLLILEPGAPLRAAAQVVALEPEGPDGHGVNWLAGKRPKPGDLLFGGDAVARALAAKNEAESRELKAAQERDELLVDAQRFRWLQEHTAATGLSRWMGGKQFLGEAVDAEIANDKP